MELDQIASAVYVDTGSERMALAVLRVITDGYTPRTDERRYEPPLSPTPEQANTIRHKRWEWNRYRAEVWRRTEEQPLHMLANIERRSFQGWHIDHVLSIWEGFRRGLPCEAIACISNLRMIEGKKNLAKGTKTVFTNLFNE